MPHFLGIDCATRTGWALVHSDKGREVLLDHNVLELGGQNAWEWVDWLVQKCSGGWRPNVVAIECPWLGKDPHALEVLARLCGRFEQAFEAAGCQVVVVKAQQWQCAVLAGLMNRTSKRAQRKRASKMWCLATYGVDLDEDRSDAAALATWAARTSRARGLGIGR
jgi:Holliday junction resolvasome RuvABC endonuclease subunit